MQSGDEEVLRACVVNLGHKLATTIWGRRAIVALPTDQQTIFTDELRSYAYVDLRLPSHDSVPVLRDVIGEAEATSVGFMDDRTLLSPPIRAHLERKGEPVEYTFDSEEPSPGAPVVVEGQLAGVVVGAYHKRFTRVLPIGIALDRIEYEELDAHAKAAICSAEGICAASDGGSVHMEHLVYALGLITDLDVCRRVEKESGTTFPDHYDVPSLDTMPPLSKHVREALDHAIRNRGTEDETSLHDLQEAVFAVECGVVKVLIDSGVEIPNAALAGYASDVPTADSDPFGVHKYAHALCTVLAAESVVPPLSIGLFAPWGAGKTSFMKAMSDRFEAINDLTRRAPKSAYRSDIVQLWFNAWHYAEQNLIASLADAVFEGLDTALTLAKKNADPEKVDEIAFAKRELEKQLETAEDDAAKSRQKLDAAEKDVAKIDQNIDAMKNDERTLDEVKRAGLALSKKEGDRYARHAAKAFGVDEKNTEQLLKDVGTIASAARKLLTSIRGWIITAGLVAVALLLVWLAKVPAPNVPTALVTLIVSIIGQLARAIHALNKARDVALADRIKEKEAAELRALAAKDELRLADEKKTEVQKKLDALSPRESMASFVRERRTSGTYARQLSVAAEAHRDFRRLSAYVKQNDVGVGRIVLYIDDLDRCPEDKVVEVLHAVHLLLAFDLFVVVVAVDSKWLLHSLKQYSKAFSERGSWQSAPLNYLEKIIQIPFTLDPMSQAGYSNFIWDLTRSALNVGGAQPSRAGSTPSQPSNAQQSQARQSSARSSAALPVDPNPAPLNFSPEETAFMSKDLYVLMSSPRNTKRFANIYRLIRATLSSASLNALVDPRTKPYEPLMILVALVTNYPQHAATILGTLQRSEDTKSWRDCIDQLPLRTEDVPCGERTVAGFRDWIPHVKRFLIQTTDR